MYAYTYMYATIINKKRDHEFEIEQREVHERVWGMEREEINDVITL